MSRQQEIFVWCVDTFGDGSALPDERAMRCIEEALELAQACGLSQEAVARITDRVYEREPGQVFKEFGQAGLTLEALAQCQDVELHDACDVEFARIIKIPKEEFAERHAAKVALGIAN